MVILGRILMGARVGFANSSSLLCKLCCLQKHEPDACFSKTSHLTTAALRGRS